MPKNFIHSILTYHERSFISYLDVLQDRQNTQSPYNASRLANLKNGLL